jgi:hypothetical protein
LLQGIDQSLGRAVWIYARRNHPSAASEDRRSLARPGRLRWLDAMRRDETLFEVFEAPGGASLSACVAQGARFDWPSARRVLSELADELAHASDARVPGGTHPVCIEQIWIDRAWSTRLLDEPIGTGGFSFKPPLELLSDVARLVLQPREHPDSRWHGGLPISAEPVVRKLLGRDAPHSSLEEASRELEGLARRPMTLTSPARAIQIAVSVIAPAFVLLVVALSMFLMTEPIDRFAESYRCIRQLRAQDATPAPAERMDEEDRRAREVVISNASTGPWVSNFNRQLKPAEVEVQKRAVEAHPVPSADEVAWARERILARPFRERKPDATKVTGGSDEGSIEVRTSLGSKAELSVSDDAEESIREVRWRILPAFTAGAVGGWGFFSTLFAMIFRGGLSLKLFGMGVRNRRGEMASRLRCAWRSLLVWIPLLVLYGTGGWLATHGHVAVGVACSLATALIHALALAYAIWRPSRSLQDRLAGTQLVPR